tara:strand:- start:222 stop:332 length:111 start_codon:yes stop_codon:yes gene_type:complete
VELGRQEQEILLQLVHLKVIMVVLVEVQVVVAVVQQ